MKVILLKEVQKLGHIGDIKEVNDGYARNYLLPRGLAIISTKHNEQIFKERLVKRNNNKKKEGENKRLLAEKINRKKIVIAVKADEKGTLYAGLSKKTIARELVKQKYNISANDIKLKEKIKKAGKYAVVLSLDGKRAVIKLEVRSLQ